MLRRVPKESEKQYIQTDKDVSQAGNQISVTAMGNRCRFGVPSRVANIIDCGDPFHPGFSRGGESFNPFQLRNIPMRFDFGFGPSLWVDEGGRTEKEAT